MSQVGLWHVSEGGPVKLVTTDSLWERQLEDWIEHDPSLLEAGLVIVGRQMTVVGGRLDLLAIDVQHRLVVIEIKPGLLYRETLAQAIDYAAAISTMSSEQIMTKIHSYLGNRLYDDRTDLQARLEIAIGDQETRDVRICLAGTAADVGLIRTSSYLASGFAVPITAVTFQIFDVADGQRVLLRELTEADESASLDSTTSTTSTRRPRTIEELCQQADESGVGISFRRMLEVANEVGLYPRPHRFSIMYTPMENRSVSLLSMPTYPDRSGGLKVWIGQEALTQFFPVSLDEVRFHLGTDDWPSLSGDQLEQLALGIEALFDRMATTRESDPQAAVSAEAGN